MKNLGVVKKEFLSAFELELRARGIAVKRRDNAFLVRTTSGVGAVYAFIIPHRGVDFDVELGVGVRIEAVEQLVNPFTHVPPRDRRHTMTFSMRLDILRSDILLTTGSICWSIASEFDFPVAVREMATFTEESLMPYIHTYSNMENAYRLLAGPVKQAYQHCPFYDALAYRAIALAAVLGMQSEVERLAELYRPILEANPSPLWNVDRFRQFVQHSKSIASTNPSAPTRTGGIRARPPSELS